MCLSTSRDRMQLPLKIPSKIVQWHASIAKQPRGVFFGDPARLFLPNKNARQHLLEIGVSIHMIRVFLLPEGPGSYYNYIKYFIIRHPDEASYHATPAA